MTTFTFLDAGTVVLFLDPYDSFSLQKEGWYRVLSSQKEGYICVDNSYGTETGTVSPPVRMRRICW